VIEHWCGALAERVDGYAVEPCAQFDHAACVIGMAVRDQDLANAPAPLAFAHNRVQVYRRCVRRIDHQRAILVGAAQNKRISAWPRHQRRVGGQ